VVAELFTARRVMLPSPTYLAGFNEFTPQQSDFLVSLGEWREFKMRSYEPEVRRRKYRTGTDEIRTAAAWAREILQQSPEAQIGLIVPDLSRLRSKVERIFRETLDPGSEFDDRKRSFHLSLGPPLNQYPVVRTALLILEFGLGRTTLPDAGMLLRSPFVAGAETERTKRGLLDAKLRKRGVWDVPPRRLREEAPTCPLLQMALHRFERECAKLPERQLASEWSRDFSTLLAAIGWPGERTLSSREYQVIEAWHGLLGGLAALDVAAAPMSFEAAITRLQEMATSSPFQIENAGAPVQTMGMLEASGLRFDHLWVMGLDDETLPAAAKPNPFLPISVQHEYNLPHSSPDRELAFASKIMERLLESAPDVILSYSQTEGDRTLGPSPVAGDPWTPAESPLTAEWIARMRTSVPFESLEDEIAPPVTGTARQPGGSSLFKDMAACPFRAFAKHRLGARPLEEADLGVNARDRGGSAHKALELIWRELASQGRLMQLTPYELHELIARCTATAVERLGPGIGRKLERQRLESLLMEWFEIERKRRPFNIVKLEEECIVALGGLEVKVRADRIDELPGGRHLILDYKTGNVNSSAWDGERPDEPQLPLYCATSTEPIAGAAFALLQAGELGFRGVAENDALPDLKKMMFDQPASLSELTVRWRKVLERLAERYSAGAAEVDPKKDACEFCGLRALCRIREFENDRG